MAIVVAAMLAPTAGRALAPTGAVAWTPRELGAAAPAGDGLGEAVAVGDFDGDGIGDVVAAAPGTFPAGQVYIVPGHDGLDADPFAIPIEPAPADRGPGFGTSLAVGDFNGDDIDDLAIGWPGFDQAGAVHVFAGGSTGIDGSRRLVLSQTGPIPGASERGDRFGQALAAGDFDGDGYDDLAIGVPGEDIADNSLVDAGMVVIAFGSSTGLTDDGAVARTQYGPVPGAAEAGDGFGESLAAGDFDNDGFADLAVGVPAEDRGTLTDSGAVNVLPGGPSGPAAGGLLFDQAGAMLGAPEAGDRFGAALTVGRFDSGPEADLAIGVPGESWGSVESAGAVAVRFGAPTLLTVEGNLLFNQSGVTPGLLDSGERFGTSLAAGDRDGDGRDDLAVGSPGDPTSARVRDGGAVIVVGGPFDSSTRSVGEYVSQTGAVRGAPERGDLFGAAVGVGDVDGDRRLDLVVGSPGEDVGASVAAGLVHVIPGAVDSPDAIVVAPVDHDQPTFGTGGRLVRYSVEVEVATGLDVGAVAATVDDILGDNRSWIGFGDVRFRRATRAGADVRIVVATPDTVDRNCAPLDTAGRLSCRQGSATWLNENRWNDAVAHWTAPLAAYRAYLVNHEVGHYLGHGHVRCPAPGALSPVMAQQTITLGGCRPNGWPNP